MPTTDTDLAGPAAAADGDDDVLRGLIGAGIAVCAWSGGTILAKGIEMGGIAIGAYRFWMFGIGLAIWMRLRGTPFRLIVMRRSMWGGLALGADIALFFSAVKETSIVNATIIGSLQPILVGIIAAKFFGEKIRRQDALWSLVALTGAIVVVAAAADDGVTSWRGNVLALLAMFSWGGYFIASKQSKQSMTSTEFTAGTSLWTAIICTPLGFAFGQDMSLPSAENWSLLILMTVGSGLIGHSLMNWSLVRIPLWVGSTFTLLIPVFAAGLAWIFLDEELLLIQGIAMSVVIAALAMVVRHQSRKPVNVSAAG